ncbi:nucleotidyltransferase substrate binding protein [Pelagibaculum spongiae]|uniref:Nucleotidyltransferase n=1 Tax=Pelagibaculum spongiae TaxID=2080658 RepID=A0A2V1GW77_9GAMM|nr:nucleotidyltransferase substrate binding protein [Pelagibaculum spongiae]PVZ68917.1 nucleotidyltransferase [Pelagibaculum spongiae]
MTQPADIRWIQRFDNYQRALGRLTDAAELAATRPLSELEQQGLIQAFEFTHELAWNTLKDFLTYRGVGQIIGSRDATRAAFKADLLESGEDWMEMIKSRNLTTHTYREEVVRDIAGKILHRYHPAFIALKTTLQQWVDQADD